MSKNGKRTGTHVECAHCETSVWKTRSELERSKSGNYFCSRRCATIVNNAKYKSGTNHPGYKSGASSYRERAIRKYGAVCHICGYDTEQVLEVHHKDHDRGNNKISNLVVLCPTHHKEYHLNIIRD